MYNFNEFVLANQKSNIDEATKPKPSDVKKLISKYNKLENIPYDVANDIYKEYDSKKGYYAQFVIRETSYPADDLARDWSAPLGGFWNENNGMVFKTERQAIKADIEVQGKPNSLGYGWHPAYDSWVQIDYYGLGARALKSDTVEGALAEASKYGSGLALDRGAGSGGFWAHQVRGYWKVNTPYGDDQYVFLVVVHSNDAEVG